MSRGNNQGLDLFSQFCFPKRFPTEFVFSKGEDPDCQGRRAAVTVVLFIWSPQLKKSSDSLYVVSVHFCI